MLAWSLSSDSQNLESLVPHIGGTFCKFLAFRSQIPRKYFRDCPEPTCNWDDWHEALNATANLKKGSYKPRVIVSYGHNGFGNQLWEHSVAFMIAEALKAKLMIAVIPDSLSPGGYIPPNTWQGMGAMEKLLPTQFLYESLPVNSSIRTMCDQEPFYMSDRPIDWRDRNYTSNFKPRLFDLLNDEKPRCLKLLGYFQNLPLCQEDARKLWTDRMLANFTQRPGPNDLSVYLRCMPRHYHFNDRHFYETILNHTTFDRIWLFQAPECPTKLGDNPAKDGMVASVVRLLTERFNATRWPGYKGPDDTLALLHDLAGLASSKKLLLPLSSWAFWAGLLSNASEIHVNTPPLHPLMNNMDRYTYHDEKKKQFFGKYNASLNDIIYAIEDGKNTLIPTEKKAPKHHSGNHTSSKHHISNTTAAGHHKQHGKHGGNNKHHHGGGNHTLYAGNKL